MEVVIFLVMVALTIVPLFKLLPAFDINPYWALAALIPLGLIVLLWVMANRLDRLKGGV